VQRLHRRNHPQLAETGHVPLLHQLDVLDAVMHARGMPG
jgi:hypothetical protein